MAGPPLPPGFVPEQSRSPGMFAARPPRRPTGVPALPPGFEVDPLESIRSSGANITSGYRDPARNRRVGGVPNSEHLDADAIDLTPGKGQSWGQLRSLADGVATSYGRGARVVDESRGAKPHIHLQLPGWGKAPVTAPTATMPPGFKPVPSIVAPKAPGPVGSPTGKVHDGDTFGLTGGSNGRLLGVDAFELGQQGRTASGQVVPLGINARNALSPFAQPGATFTPNGTFTYGRPVGTLNNGEDAGRSMLETGNALAAPQFLQGNPLLGQYMEAERLARLNRRGAHANTYQTPQSFRAGNPDPWAKPESAKFGEGVAVFADERTPFQGLRPEIEQGYMNISRTGSVDDIMEYAKANSFNIRRADVQKFVTARDRGNPVNYKVFYEDAPKPLIDPGDGTFGAAARGFADPINMLDEMGAVVDTLGGTEGRESLWNSDRRFGDILWNNIDQNRAILGHDDEYHPYARFGGQIASGIVLPVGVSARTPMALAKIGAIEGGLAGFGAGEGGPIDRLPNAAVGTVLGGATGATLGRVINDFAGGGLNPVRREVQDTMARQAGYEAAPVVNDAMQAAGPTPASRFQPQGGIIPAAAMRMEDDSPELVGRVRDYIDIPAMPPGFVPEMRRVEDVSRLMDVEDAASGITPESVLPPSAYAPDEFDTLGTRTFPRAGTRSAYQRGPVDLVGFVRSRGGLQDEGGELSHLGIDNKPRDMDFAQGEGFLGGLVRSDGHSLDDMAEAAWEAGYFPEFPERPSVNDFLDALADTHGGHGRRFHPDDMAEVAEFEANREQRLAMEAAGDAMPEVRRVANMNVAKIETPQDIRQALASIHSAIGDNPSLARQSHKETAALAEQLGMTPQDFLKRRQGQPLNAAEALALRNLHAASLDNVFTAAKKAVGGSDADKAAFLKAVHLSAALGDHASGAAAETGRALSQYRMVAKASKDSQEAIRRALQGRGGPESVDQLAQDLIELERDPSGAARFVQKITKPGFKDYFNELYINSLVSGPKTHAVNIISNLATMGLQLPEHALAAGLGALRRGSTDKVYFSELGPRIVGMLQGAKTGLANARRALITGRASDDVNKIDVNFQHAIPGKVGHIIRTPTRLLTAEDEFSKGQALGFELAGQAIRKAKAEGLKGDALTRRIAELNADPTEDMLKAGRDYARYVTFQRQLGAIGQGASRFSNDVPGAKVLVPFVRTPTNLLKFAVERSPFAPLLKEWRADMAAGGARRDLALVRASSGSALGSLAASWAAQGIITGGGPADPNAKRTLMASGWQPYSVKIGGKYYSYARIDPLATTLGMAADYVDKQSRMTESQADDYATTIVQSIMQNLENKVWLQSIADLDAAIDDRDGGAFVRKTLATLAVPVGVSQLAQAVDPQPRESKTVGEAIMARVPGLSDNLRPRLDVWGQPLPPANNVGPNILSPFAISQPRQQDISNEALRLGLKITDPSRKVGDRKLTNEEFHAYRRAAGDILTQRFGQIIGSPEWQAMDDDEKRREFERSQTGIKAQARADARLMLGLGGDKEPSKLPPPPAGFVIPPMPPGFVPEGPR